MAKNSRRENTGAAGANYHPKIRKGGNSKGGESHNMVNHAKGHLLAVTSIFIYRSRKLASDKWENQLILTNGEAAVCSETSSQTSTHNINAMASPSQITLSKYLSQLSYGLINLVTNLNYEEQIRSERSP